MIRDIYLQPYFELVVDRIFSLQIISKGKFWYKKKPFVFTFCYYIIMAIPHHENLGRSSFQNFEEAFGDTYYYSEESDDNLRKHPTRQFYKISVLGGMISWKIVCVLTKI